MVRPVPCLAFTVALAACGALDEDDGETSTRGDSNDDSSGAEDGLPTSTTETLDDDDDDDDDGDDDDATSDETGGGDSDSGPDPVALPDDVFLFVRKLGDGDALWAYDVARDTAQEVTRLDEVSTITSIAIDSSRTVVAFASDHGAIDFQASEAIYAFQTNEALVPEELALLMPPIPKPIGASTGYKQQLDDLRWHPDNSILWFGHAFQFDFSSPGGGTLAGVDPATGDYELFLDAVGGCTVNTGASPSPDGSVLLAIKGVCTDSADEGIVAFEVPPSGEPEMVAPTTAAIFSAPRWLPDASGIVYATAIDHDSDGDGATDVYGDAIVLLDLETGDQFVLLPPTPNVSIWELTLSPAADAVVACISHDGLRDLLLLDYSSDEPSSRWLTDDGGSCKPSW